MSTPMTPPPSSEARLPFGIWAIGFSNLFLNISTTMVYSLSAVFLTTVLGASTTMFGLIDGFVEAIALSVRVGSGWTSDHYRRRKPLLYLGYGLSIISRLLMAMTGSVGFFFSARVMDRLGNGIQAAPRDALVGDIAPRASKGAAFGLRQTLAVIGSLVAPLIVVGLMSFSGDNYRFVFYASVIPAILGLILLVFLVQEPPTASSDKEKRTRFSLKLLKELYACTTGYWSLVLLGGVFTMARFSEGFMILRMKDLGLTPLWIATVMLVMNGFTALAAYPTGRWSDTMDRRRLLAVSTVFMMLAGIVLATATTWYIGFIGVALWGIQIGASQSLFMSMILDYAPDKKFRALAFGVFFCVGGAVHFVTNLIAGSLWDTFGPSTPFFYSAAWAALAFVGTWMLRRIPQSL